MHAFRLRSRSVLLLLAPVLFTALSCRRGGPQSIIRMSDLHTQNQLLSGFYSLESGAWRWTGKTFTVSLKTPPDGASTGCTLTLQGTVVPESLTNGPLQISASVGETALAPQSVTKPGEAIYRVNVPAAALQRPVVIAQFSLSSIHRVPGDLRDLGIIASVISLRSK